jgi:hypothetical protein
MYMLFTKSYIAHAVSRSRPNAYYLSPTGNPAPRGFSARLHRSPVRTLRLLREMPSLLGLFTRQLDRKCNGQLGEPVHISLAPLVIQT